MEKTRKLVDIDFETLEILKQEAKRQNRSLKNLLENTIRNTAKKWASPSKEYSEMMDEMLERINQGEVDFTPVSEVKKRYGL